MESVSYFLQILGSGNSRIFSAVIIINYIIFSDTSWAHHFMSFIQSKLDNSSKDW